MHPRLELRAMVIVRLSSNTVNSKTMDLMDDPQGTKEVNMLAQLQSVDEGIIHYARGTDFCEIFTEEMHSLYLLSFLLTADKDKAEQCFIGGLGECVEGIGAFMEWSRLWARRAIIKQAILMMSPAPEDMDHWSPISTKGPAAAVNNGLFAAILSLGTFERFVFVLSILEGQSDGDCLSLLRCSRSEVVIARELALRLLVTNDRGGDHSQEALHAWQTFMN
jgi:hypothetical protein